MPATPDRRPCPHCESINTRVEPERPAGEAGFAGRQFRRYDAVGHCGGCGRSFTTARVEPAPADVVTAGSGNGTATRAAGRW